MMIDRMSGLNGIREEASGSGTLDHGSGRCTTV
jgi:hypothetical protein